MAAEPASFLNLYKPPGLSSFDCIRRLRRILGTRKMGHMGTLDPPAEGVLPVAIGAATRLIPYLSGGRKGYRATFQLGITTDTDDMSGAVVSTWAGSPVGQEAIRSALLGFVGETMQTPPSVSAVKVEGKRAYRMARSGEPPCLSPRPARAYRIDVLECSFPFVTVEMETAPGFYVRSLARDLGVILGCGGAVKSLLRFRSGNFVIEESHGLDEVEEAAKTGDAGRVLLSPACVMGDFSRGVVRDDALGLIANGRAIGLEHIVSFTGKPSKEGPGEDAHKGGDFGPVILLDGEGGLVAVARTVDGREFFPEKVFVACPVVSG